MAKVNRFAKTQTTTYQPRTLQELMMVPAYKRKQHDELSAGIAEYETQLAQSDAADEHMDALGERQDLLYTKMQEQRDKLNKEGFSQSAKSDFIRFNKEYQKELGAQGEIGKMKAAKEAMTSNEKLYISTAVKDGYSPEQAKINWENHRQVYADEFKETGKVSSIDELYAPKYVDHIEEGRKYFKDAGITEKDITSGGGAIKMDENGSYVVNSKHRNASASNKAQLQAAADFINNRLNNPNSDLAKSIKHQGKTSQAAIKDILGMSGIYQKDKTLKSNTSTTSGYKPLSQKETMFDGKGLTAVSTRYDNNDMIRSYAKVGDRLEELNNKENLSQDEKAELSKYTEYQAEMNQRLDAIPEAKALKDAYRKAQEDFDAYQKGTYQMSENEQIAADALASNFLNKREGAAKANAQIGKSIVERMNRLGRELEPFSEKVATDIRLVTNNYAITPVTTKQQSAYNVFKNSVRSIIQSDGHALKENTNMLRVTDDEGNGFTSLSENDKDHISELVYNADPNDLEITTFTPKAADGLPGYSVKVRVKDSYNLDGIAIGSDTIGGEDEYITVDVTFDNTNNGIVRNLNGFAQEFLQTTGADGRALVSEMRMNDTRQEYKGYTWGELNAEGATGANPNLTTLYKQEIKNYLMSKGIQTPSKEDFEAAEIALKNKTFQ